MPLDLTYNFALAREMLVSLTCRDDHETPLVVACLTNDPTISTTIQINIHVGQRLAREGTVRVVGSEPAISRPLGKVCEIWRVFVDIRLVLRGRHDRRSWSTHRGTRITELSDCRETSRGSFFSSLSLFSRARATDRRLGFSRHTDEDRRINAVLIVIVKRSFDETFLTDDAVDVAPS